MDVRELFKDEFYDGFSEEEMSQIEALSEEESRTVWYQYCDSEVVFDCWFIPKIVSGALPMLTWRCGWGWGNDNWKEETGQLLKKALEKQLDGVVNICYKSKCGLRVPVRLFCDKWYEFCFSYWDRTLLDLGEKALLYYDDDTFYWLEKRSKV